MVRYFLLPLLLLLIYLQSFAQIDTRFWFAAPEVTALHADSPVYLRISAMDEAASVTISQPADPTFEPITRTVAANTTISIDLSSRLANLENKPEDKVLDKGLYIESTREITAYYEVLGSTFALGVVNSDIFTLKGKNGLGTRFYTPFQNHWDNNPDVNAWSSIDIVATEDTTIVTIVPTREVVGHPAGVPFSVTLHKGQTYSARAYGFAGADHLSGTLITSDKPIAVTIKDDSIIEGNSWDLVGDQLIPVEHTGTDYVVLKASSYYNSDRIFICATEDGTEVYKDTDAFPMATLNKGQTFEFQLTDFIHYIRTSLPAYVFHVCGFYDELGGALLPPVKCTGSKLAGFTRTTDEPFGLNIVVKSGGENYFKLNGKTGVILPAAFSTVPGTGGQWVAAQIFFSVDEFPVLTLGKLSNDSADFHLGVMNGADNTGFRYGYFSDYAGVELGPGRTICKGDSTELNAGFGKTSYLWNTGEASQKIWAKDSTMYRVTITKGGCSMFDSLRIKFFPPIGRILGNDTSVCSNTGFMVKPDSTFSAYLWNNGSTAVAIHPERTATYWLEVTNDNGCRKRDSIDVEVFIAPRPQIRYNMDLEKVCWDELITLDVTPEFKKYRWQSGDTTKTIVSPHLEEYYVTVTDSNNCTDSTHIYIDCSPYIKVYNLFTPNRDGHNESFYVEGLKPGKWSLEIFDRWGGRIYYNKNYDNDFYGEGLGDGVYYYSLNHHSGKKTIKGWFQVIGVTDTK